MALAEACPEGQPRALGLAVSGGGDSMALLRAGAQWAQRRRAAVFVATVDHGLRPEAASEAAFVAETCVALDLPHHVLTAPEEVELVGSGNLQGAARSLRYGLLSDWARDLELSHVALAHTMDDQAETVLMRLARGSGVDGLSAMSALRHADGLYWLRPFLGLRRADLRDALGHWDQEWIEDPSNDDTRFDRIKARKALTHLGPLGLDVARLARTAQIMSDARAALQSTTQTLAARAATIDDGDVLLDQTLLAQAPFDIRARLLAHALGWVSGAVYRPRLRALQAVMDRLAEGRTQTLQGCLLTVRDNLIRVAREPAAVSDLCTPAPGIWDGRWRIVWQPSADDTATPAPQGLHLRPTGDSTVLTLSPGQRGTLPRSSRAALPAVWEGDRLVAAPLPGVSDGNWGLVHLKDGADFTTSLMAD